MGGERLPKDDPRIEAVGSLDELNAALGWAAAACSRDESGWLAEVQNRLFDIGAELAAVGDVRRSWEQLDEHDVRRLEELIDTWDAELPPLRSFDLPVVWISPRAWTWRGTVARRAERRLVAGLPRWRPARGPPLPQPPIGPALRRSAGRGNARHGVDEPKYKPRQAE